MQCRAPIFLLFRFPLLPFSLHCITSVDGSARDPDSPPFHVTGMVGGPQNLLNNMVYPPPPPTTTPSSLKKKKKKGKFEFCGARRNKSLRPHALAALVVAFRCAPPTALALSPL